MRSGWNRSRYGCKTCRIRRVKCDEGVPSCQRCVSSGRRCEGPPAEKITIRQYMHRTPTSERQVRLDRNPPSALFVSNSEESRAFDFYLQKVAPALGGPLDKELWQVLLPQICHSDAAVKNAVLAIATLYEYPLLTAYQPPPKGIVYTDEQRKGINWYARSVSNAATCGAVSDEIGQIESRLLTCLLFTSVEIQHANVASTINLLEHGFSLAASYLQLRKTCNTRRPAWIQDTLLTTLARQTVTFGIFGYALTPGAYAAIDQLIPAEETKVSSLKEARDTMYAILIRSFMFVQRISAFRRHTNEAQVPAKLLAQQRRLLDWLQSWWEGINRLTAARIPSDEAKAVVHMLSSWHQVCYLWLSRSIIGKMNGDDEELQCLSSILQHADLALKYMSRSAVAPSSRPFVIELGVMPPLYFVAWQCRVPGICSQAIKLMKHCPAQESLFVTELQIKAVERVQNIENQLSVVTAALHATDDEELAVLYSDQARALANLVDRSLFLPRQRPLIFDT